MYKLETSERQQPDGFCSLIPRWQSFYEIYVFVFERRERDWPDPWERSDGDDVSVQVSPTVQVEQTESHQVAQVAEQQR